MPESDATKRAREFASGFLCLAEKQGVKIDLASPVNAYIAANYNEGDARDAADDVAATEALRSEVVEQTQSLDVRKETLVKYFRALAVMEVRFPISKEPEHIDLEFTWFDSVKTTKKATQPNIHFEKAAVLYNIAAIQTQQAAHQDRTSAEGIKTACHLFQMAAGSCAHLRDTVGVRVSPGATPDLSKEACNMLVWLNLAQAQECVHAKAVADSKSVGILAKLAKQTATYYEEVGKALGCKPLSEHYDKAWAAHVGLKAATFTADAYYRLALQCKGEEKIGVELARLKQAVATLQAAKRAGPKPGLPLDQLAALEALVLVEQSVASKDNECVYMEQVPSPDTLPALTGHSLVKPLAPNEILDPKSGESLFAMIVPDSSTKALSKYTEMVDELSRQQQTALERATEEARAKLAALELPDLVHAAEGRGGAALTVPPGIRNVLEEVAAAGGAEQALGGMVAQLQQMRAATAEMLIGAVRTLDDEARDDAHAREAFGAAWKRPPSAALAAPMRERLETYRQNLTQANASDQDLQARVAEAGPAFASLHPERVGELLPRLSAPLVSLADDADAPRYLASLKRLLGEAEGLAAERARLEDALREAKDKDNILTKVLAAPESYDALFQAELQKYGPLQTRVAQNAATQSELLKALAAHHERFCYCFQVEEWKAACGHAMGHVQALVDQYRQLCDNLQEGVVFYTNLQDAIAQLARQCDDFVYSRNLHAADLREECQAGEQRRAADEHAARMAGERAAAERAARDRAASAQAQFSQMNLSSGHGYGPLSPQLHPGYSQPPYHPQPAHPYAPPAAPPPPPQYGHPPPYAPGYPPQQAHPGYAQHPPPAPPPQYGHPQQYAQQYPPPYHQPHPPPHHQ